MFTYEDKIIIKYLRQKFCHGAIKIIDDHPERNAEWSLGGMKALLQHIDSTGDITRKEGSGRPRTVRIEATIDEVGELIHSQEDHPNTHMTPSEISAHLGVSESSVRRIVSEDIRLKPLKKITNQSLSEGDIAKRLERCNKLICKYTNKVLESAFFSDEKIFKVQQHYNHQNDRVYVSKDTLASEVSAKRIQQGRTGFPKSIMVSVSVSKLGKTSIHFVEPGCKVNAEYYRGTLLKDMIPEMDKLSKKQPYLFMQDGARSHTAKDTMAFLRSQHYLEVLEPDMWPPNSPDLNPVDFCIWGVLGANVYRGRRITDLDQLKDAICEEWEKFPQETIDNAIDSYRQRLRQVVAENGGHIEHYH